MSYTPKMLAAQAYVPSPGPTLAYTSPAAGKGTWIDKVNFSNDTAGPQTVTVWLIPPAGAAGSDTKVVPLQSVASKVQLTVAELAGKFIDAGYAIHWGASAATSINGSISGREVN